MTRRADTLPQRTAGPFALHAANYLEHGYAPIPVKPGAKRPLISDWPRWCDELPSLELVATWARRYPGAGIAIACGPASGITALDLDDDIDGLHARICQELGPSPVAKRGARAPTHFYRYNSEHSRALRKNGHTVAELLAGKRLAIIPPTIHPDTGQPYQWLTRETLLDRSAASLPTLDAQRLAALFDEPKRQRPRPRSREPENRSRDAGVIAAALKHIPADIDRHSWIRIGMALKSAIGDPGFELWDAWSSTGTKYHASQMQAQWRSFAADGRITAGTLFYFGLPRPEISTKGKVRNSGVSAALGGYIIQSRVATARHEDAPSRDDRGEQGAKERETSGGPLPDHAHRLNTPLADVGSRLLVRLGSIGG